MAVRRKGTVQPPEGAKPAEGEAKTEQKTESKKKGPSTQSVAGLVKYSVPKDVRKPRENSIIEAIYNAIEPNFGTDECEFDQVATATTICDAVADKLKKPKAEEDATYSRGDVLSTLRWLLGKERIIKVDDGKPAEAEGDTEAKPEEEAAE